MLDLLAQNYNYSYSYDYSSSSGSLPGWFWAVMIGYYAVVAVITIIVVVAMWRIFTKAGKPGWAAIVPIYSDIVKMEVIGRPGWWFLIYMVPIFGIYVIVLDAIWLARSFNKGGGFAAGLILLPLIFYPILAFGKNEYQGAPASGTSLSI